MAFCSNCGQELSEGAKFCAVCGTATTQAQSKGQNQRKTVFEGNIHKCPNCGGVLNSFTLNCPSCGYEVRGAANSDAVHEFASQLAKAGSHQEKVSIIRNYPIPNTKEDILEFMILASANVGSNLENNLSAAWQSKIEQAYQKARLLFKDEKELCRIQSIYDQVCAKLDKERKIKNAIKAGRPIISELMPVLPNVILVTGWLISIFALLPLCRVNLYEDGTNLSQILLMLDLVVGTVFVPFTVKCDSELPKLIVLLGLLLSIAVLFPLCSKYSDQIWATMYRLILTVDIICSIVVFTRMFRSRRHSTGNKAVLNRSSLVIAFACMLFFLVVYGIGSISSPVTSASNEKANQEEQSVTYTWPTSGINQFLPQPPTQYGRIKTDDETRFNMEVYNISDSQFEDYVKACKEKGFTISITKNDEVFYAYHEEQYKLDIIYWDDKEKMDILIDAPLEMTEIRWPDNKLVNQIPQPESLIGNIRWENAEYFSVYIANTTPEQYAEYVDKCMDEGFTIDYSRGDKTFHAYNKAGYYLVVEKHLFDKIYISIEIPEKD